MLIIFSNVSVLNTTYLRIRDNALKIADLRSTKGNITGLFPQTPKLLFSGKNSSWKSTAEEGVN